VKKSPSEKNSTIWIASAKCTTQCGVGVHNEGLVECEHENCLSFLTAGAIRCSCGAVGMISGGNKGHCGQPTTIYDDSEDTSPPYVRYGQDGKHLSISYTDVVAGSSPVPPTIIDTRKFYFLVSFFLSSTLICSISGMKYHL
jgi:hypothetical protein